MTSKTPSIFAKIIFFIQTYLYDYQRLYSAGFLGKIPTVPSGGINPFSEGGQTFWSLLCNNNKSFREFGVIRGRGKQIPMCLKCSGDPNLNSQQRVALSSLTVSTTEYKCVCQQDCILAYPTFYYIGH